MRSRDPKRGTYWYFAPDWLAHRILFTAVIALFEMWICHAHPGPGDLFWVGFSLAVPLVLSLLPLVMVIHWRVLVWRYLKRRRQGLR